MLRFDFTLAEQPVTLWEEASAASGASQDSWLAVERRNGFRLAVIDGSTPPWDARGRAGVDAAAWAAAVVRATLTSDQEVVEALEQANAHLYQADLRSQAQSMATVICAEPTAHGWSFVRAGNCEAWIEEDGGWTSLFGPQWPEDVLARYKEALAAHPEASAREVSELEERIFGTPEAWVSVPPGRFPTVKLEALSWAGDWGELVLTTDGARLDGARVADLDTWLADIRDWEKDARKSYAVEKRRDDVTVLRIKRPYGPAVPSGSAAA